MTIQLVPYEDAKFDLKGIKKKLQAAMEAEAAKHRELLGYTTKMWKGQKPEFRSVIVASPQRLFITTEPFGDSLGAWKWRWLEKGTATRWALMSRNFVPKTSRGVLGSQRGKGRVVMAGRRAMLAAGVGPRPGIRARNWTAEVTKLRNKKFQGEMRRTFDLIALTAIHPAGLRQP